MSGLARTSVLRGIQTMRSSGPHPTVGGRWAMVSPVMSLPITAKSPVTSSRMSGQPFRHEVVAPLAWGSGPRRRRIMVRVSNYS